VFHWSPDVLLGFDSDELNFWLERVEDFRRNG
jgi:hypothetical protein